MFEGPYRASDISTWLECGHRYELLRERLEKPTWRSPEAINGTAMHLVIHQIHDEKLWGAPAADLLDRYRAAVALAEDEPHEIADMGVPVRWGEYISREAAISEWRTDMLAILLGYSDDPRNRDANLIGLELFWETEIGGVPMRGRIDQVRDLHGLHVVDFKSGNQRPTEQFLPLWTQGFIYAAAVESILKEMPKTVAWVQLRDYVPYKVKSKAAQNPGPRGKVFYTVDVTDGAMESVRRELWMFQEAIRAGRFERRPSPIGCSYCKVADRCVMGFRGALSEGAISTLKVTEEAYCGEEGIE